MPITTKPEFINNLDKITTSRLLGNFNLCEITEITMECNRSHVGNIFTLIVLEEHSEHCEKKILLPSRKDYLNKERIILNNLGNTTFGILRYYRSIKDLKIAIDTYFKSNKWTLYCCNSSPDIGELTPQSPQFIPADATEHVQLNKVLKNNFFSGSYVLELFDNYKNKYNNLLVDHSLIQNLSEKISQYVPLQLASMTDRIGNIVIQIPSLLLSFQIRFNSNSESSCRIAWRDQSRDNCILFFSSDRDGVCELAKSISLPHELTFEVPIGNTDFIQRLYICDDHNDIIIGASSRIYRLNSINLGIECSNSGTRRIILPNQPVVEIPLRGKMMYSNIGIKRKTDEWIQKRIYNDEKQIAEKQHKFKQFGLFESTDNEHEDALHEIRTIINMFNQGKVWLWDPFLEANDIIKTLFYTELLGTQQRALGDYKSIKNHYQSTTTDDKHSKREDNTTDPFDSWKKDQIELLTKQDTNGLNIEYRVKYNVNMNHFHDRFLIMPQDRELPKVWSLGTSINSIGKSHHIIYEITTHAGLIADAFSDMWDKLSSIKLVVWKHP
jgi:hypothetical protein